MIRLSRPAWNNVIIFAILGFILLINFSQKNLFNNTQEASFEQPLLGEQAVILSLQVNQEFLVERIGQGWRAKPTVMSEQLLAQMMASWSVIQATKLSEPPVLNQQGSVVVSIQLAGQSQADIYSLYPEADQLFILQHTSGDWFTLAKPLYWQLIPKQLMQ